MTQALDLNKIRKFLASQPVAKAWLFGSYARGEQTDTSDVDLLVRFDDGVGIFKYCHILRGLETIFNRNVDLVSEGTLVPWAQKTVDHDKILIYER